MKSPGIMIEKATHSLHNTLFVILDHDLFLRAEMLQSLTPPVLSTKTNFDKSKKHTSTSNIFRRRCILLAIILAMQKQIQMDENYVERFLIIDVTFRDTLCS